MKQTALYQEHVRLNGQMVDFGGWSLPVRYDSIVKEHLAVREGVGIFDASHMGNFYLVGEGAYDFVNHLISNDLEKIGDGQGVYSGMLYENGTFVDDLIVYQIDRKKFVLIVNAGNLEKDYQWIQEQLDKTKADCKLYDLSEKKSLLAIQGKQSAEIISKLFPTHPLSPAFSFTFAEEGSTYYGTKLLESETPALPTLISNTGYTGESGVEVLIDNELAVDLFNQVLSHGVAPCGLGARDSLRMEKGFSLYGHEITDQTNALEAGLGWTISFTKDFIGKDALIKIKEVGTTRKMVGLLMEGRRVPREGTEIYDEDEGRRVGVVTSGGVSPTLNRNIALGYVEKGYSSKIVKFKIRDDFYPAEIVNRVMVSNK